MKALVYQGPGQRSWQEVDTRSTPTLIELVASHQIDTSPMITHRFRLNEFEAAYDVFSNAGENGALKVLPTSPK